jgi:Ca2+-binding RTX toxin-like protein
VADTTIPGLNGAPAVTIPASVAVNNTLLAALDKVITDAINIGAFSAPTGLNIAATTVTGGNAIVQVTVGGSTTVPAGYGALLNVSNTSALTVQAAAGLDVLSGDAGIAMFVGADTLNGTGGSASGTSTIVATGGNNLFSIDKNTTYNISLGNGSDTVYANGSGLTDMGGGVNLVTVDKGVNTVFASGVSDTIVSGTGSATIGSGGAKAKIYTGSGNSFVASGGANSTIVAGTGATTIFAGADSTTFLTNSSSPLFIAAGNASSTVVGGATSPTIFGNAGSNITYFNSTNASGAILIAGAGSETLNASGSTTGNAMFAGANNSTLIGGTGSDLIVGSAGTGTLTGGAGSDLFIFNKGAAGGTFVITDFAKGSDVVLLSRYATTEIASAVGSAVVSGNTTSITLTDNTKITFSGITSVDASMFR